MCICVNDYGYELVRFIEIREEEIDNYSPLTCTLMLVNHDDRLLSCFQRVRKQWEIPGGSIEIGETPKEGAIRELFEETNQKVNNAKFIVLAQLYNTVDMTTEYLAVFQTTVNELNEFNENSEISEIRLWDTKENIGKFDSVIKAIIDYCV
ncbi:NUDIX hydrolase [Clostridiaceae bacterium M8S5]|nr:NUDIX hydrolase [Clostridiaceae bacterium M8S5]